METAIVTPFRAIASDDLGMFKVAQAPSVDQLDSLACTIKWGEPIKDRAIECMSIAGNTPATALLAAGRITGEIDLINPISGVLIHKIKPNEANNTKEVAIVGVHLIANPNNDDSASAEQPAVLSVTQGGVVRVLFPQTDGRDTTWEESRTWKAPQNVCCSAYDPESNLLAVGCQGAELKLFNVATGELAFAAKGGKPNAIRLVDPAWNSAVAFIPGSEGKKIVVGTGHHKLRLYDTTVGKRPQVDVVFGETRITALAPEPNGTRCWVANGLGQVEVYDFVARRFSGAIKGIAGSVRQLALLEDGRLIASVGLDRFLRIHNTQSRVGVAKVYLKTQLTGVGFVPMPSEKVGVVNDGDDNQKTKKKKKKSKSSSEKRPADISDDDKEEDEDVAAAQKKKKKNKKSK